MNKRIKNGIIILLIVVGFLSIIISTINYAYRIPELDRHIDEKKHYLTYTLAKFNDANFGYINSNIHANTLDVLCTLMNITDVNLVFLNKTYYFNGTVFEPGNYVEFKSNGEYRLHGSETEETKRLIKNLLAYRSDIVDMVVNYYAGHENHSFEVIMDIDRITDFNVLSDMIITYSNESVNNMNRISTEIDDLEKQKSGILFWSLFFQISGIILSQIAIILHTEWKPLK